MKPRQHQVKLTAMGRLVPCATTAIALATLLAASTQRGNAQTSGPRLTTIYTFTGGSDGSSPNSLLITKTGLIYGTTTSGGAMLAGTVFQLHQPSVEGGTWTETTLYSFKGVPDGFAPNPGLTLAANGDLYGTTSAGGTSFSQNPACPSDLNGCGTVFRLAPPKSGSAWQESVLYRFSLESAAGIVPAGGVLVSNGVIYGTAAQGGVTSGCGTFGCGAAYSIVPGVITPLHAFTGIDGAYPNGPFVAQNGTFYGTTTGGETAGVVFSLTPPATTGGAWTENTVYNFTGTNGDGSVPNGLLIAKNGTLYGTTESGGINGNGIVFQLVPPAVADGSWTENVLHHFTGAVIDSRDGSEPVSLVIDASGNLYGATYQGGTVTSACPSGCGALFKLTPPTTGGEPWQESILYRFQGTSDGLAPCGLAINAKRTFRGGSGRECGLW
jgi:hypothetical protein